MDKILKDFESFKVFINDNKDNLANIKIDDELYLIEYLIIYNKKYLKYLENNVKITIKDPIKLIEIYSKRSCEGLLLIEYVIKKCNIQVEQIKHFDFFRVNHYYIDLINKNNYKRLLETVYIKYYDYEYFDKNLLETIAGYFIEDAYSIMID